MNEGQFERFLTAIEKRLDDHDLLIQLNESVKRLSSDIKGSYKVMNDHIEESKPIRFNVHDNTSFRKRAIWALGILFTMMVGYILRNELLK